MNLTKSITSVFALFLIACGPPRLPTDPGADSSATEETGSDATTTTSSDPDPSDTSTTDDPTTAGFVWGYDVLGDPCDAWLQDCPDGEKCVPYASSGGNWDANKCVPLMGDQAVGEPCTYGGAVEATDDCDATSMCWNADRQGEGVCHAFCTGSPDDPMCPDNSSCLVSGDGALSICMPRCDPLLQDCDTDLGCYWSGSAFECAPNWEGIPAGQECGFINDCDIGLICVATQTLPDCAGPSCCTAFCDIELGDGQCEALPGTSCVPFFEEGFAPPQYENVGFCIVP